MNEEYDVKQEPISRDDLPPVRSVGFWEAVRLAYTQYATFSGRATRKEYFYYLIFNLTVSLTLMGLAYLEVPLAGIVQTIYSWGALIPGLALCFRRLHDGGYSGWAYLWLLLPIAGPLIFLLIIFWSSDADNKYGPRKVAAPEELHP